MAGIQIRVSRKGRISYIVRYRPYAGARQVSQSYRSERAARRRVEDIHQAQDSGLPIPPGRRSRRAALPTLGTWWPDYYKRRYADRTDRTRDAVVSQFMRHICHDEYGVADIPMIEFEFEPQILERFQIALMDEDQGDLGWNAARHVRGLVSRMLADAATSPTRSGVQTNPLREGGPIPKLRKPPARDRIAVPPLPIELMRVVIETDPDVPPEQRAAALILLDIYYQAGLRWSEALALRWRDVRGHSLSVRGQLTKSGGIKYTKTRSSRETDKLPTLEESLLAYEHVCTHTEDDDFLFPWWHGSAGASARKIMNRARREAARLFPEWNVPPEADFRELTRHSCISMWLRAGWANDIDNLADQMGNSPDVINEYYRHAIKEFSFNGPVDLPAEIRKARARARDLAAQVLDPIVDS